MAFSNFNPKISKKAFFVVNISIFLFLHETSRIEKFDGTDFDNGNSFFSNSSKKYLNTKFYLKT